MSVACKCSAAALFACKGCNQAFYCSKECQRQDWHEGAHSCVCAESEKIGVGFPKLGKTSLVKLKQGDLVSGPKAQKYKLAKRIDESTYTSIWEASKEGSTENYILKISSLAHERTKMTFIAEVYTARVLQEKNVSGQFEGQVCTRLARCGIESFKSKSVKNAGVIAFPTPIDTPLDMRKFIKQRLHGASVKKAAADKRFRKDLLQLALDLCGDVRDLHALGIVHRDLKPENVLVDELKTGGNGYNTVLIDFGFATVFEPKLNEAKALSILTAPDTVTDLGGIVDLLPSKKRFPAFFTETSARGTFLYMSPRVVFDETGAYRQEELNKERLVEADVFAIGCILYAAETAFLNMDNVASFRDPVDILEWIPPSDEGLLLNTVIQGMVTQQEPQLSLDGAIAQLQALQK